MDLMERIYKSEGIKYVVYSDIDYDIRKITIRTRKDDNSIGMAWFREEKEYIMLMSIETYNDDLLRHGIATEMLKMGIDLIKSKFKTSKKIRAYVKADERRISQKDLENVYKEKWGFRKENNDIEDTHYVKEDY